MKHLREIVSSNFQLKRNKEQEEGLGDGTVEWYDIHHQGKEVGNVTYHAKNGIAHALPILYGDNMVHPLKPHEGIGRGKGIGPQLYKHLSDKAKSEGNKLMPTGTLTPDGYKLWQKHNPKAVKNHKYNSSTDTYNKDE